MHPFQGSCTVHTIIFTPNGSFRLQVWIHILKRGAEKVKGVLRWWMASKSSCAVRHVKENWSHETDFFKISELYDWRALVYFKGSLTEAPQTFHHRIFVTAKSVVHFGIVVFYPEQLAECLHNFSELNFVSCFQVSCNWLVVLYRALFFPPMRKNLVFGDSMYVLVLHSFCEQKQSSLLKYSLTLLLGI